MRFLADDKGVISTEVLVIGGGPAGLCAGIEALKLGAGVLVLDDKERLGGQLVKQTHMFFGSKNERAGIRGIDIAVELIDEFVKLGGRVMPSAIALGIYDDGMVGVLRDERRFLRIRAQKIVAATGAYENMLAFPGCDLPGVYGAGGFQTLMNLDGVLPGKNVLMVGAGNIGLIVSYQLVQAGGDVVAVVEAAPKVGGYHVHAAKIRRIGIPIMLSHSVKSVGGNGRVEYATIVALENFREVGGSEFTVACDAVCLSVGLTPLVELFSNAGVRMRYVAALGGAVPEHDENMTTSNPDIFVAGDASGIEEASAAMVEGKIAGAVAAGALKKTDVAGLVGEFRRQLDALRAGPFGAKARQGKFELWGRSYRIEDEERSLVAPELDFTSGRRVVFECGEEIPCNPCEESCRFGAISIGADINRLPQLDPEKCTGCGVCLTRCPGLSIFLIDMDAGDGLAEITVPYELRDLPQKGDTWAALDRDGNFVCDAPIVRVRYAESFDRKHLISFTVPKERAHVARHVAPRRRVEKLPPRTVAAADADPIVCRCEDVKLSEIESAIDAGYHTFEELKRILRVGMGPCQGKTCQRVIIGVLARKLGKPPSELAPMRVRAPMKPIGIEVLSRVALDEIGADRIPEE